MRWLNTRVHRGEYRHKVAAKDFPVDLAPSPIETACPTCGAGYFADVELGYDDWALEADCWEAEVRLEAECPDHPHRFEVGNWGVEEWWLFQQGSSERRSSANE